MFGRTTVQRALRSLRTSLRPIRLPDVFAAADGLHAHAVTLAASPHMAMA
jgi:hypothetical protein